MFDINLEHKGITMSMTTEADQDMKSIYGLDMRTAFVSVVEELRAEGVTGNFELNAKVTNDYVNDVFTFHVAFFRVQ